MPAKVLEALDGLAIWLAEKADRALPDLHAGFCEELRARGLPLWRSVLGLELLHPEQSGVRSIWSAEPETNEDAALRGVYMASPVRVIDVTERPFRSKLAGLTPDSALMQELSERGITDFVNYKLPFLDASRSSYIAFVTREEGGFSEESLVLLAAASRLFSPYAERRVLRRIAIDLLDTYVGHHAGELIFDGQIRRGGVATIEAAILMCDLRGFTLMSRTHGTSFVIDRLNGWFDAVALAVTDGGGEVLKFMGDGLLAIFRAEAGSSDACRRALAATQAAKSAVAELNAGAATEEPLVYATALHVGEVAYGNVGSSRRLDFTVLGPAVNYASRLQELAKRLNQPVLMSQDFAECVAAELTDLGSHSLRSIGKSERVFTLPEAAVAGAASAA